MIVAKVRDDTTLKSFRIGLMGLGKDVLAGNICVSIEAKVLALQRQARRSRKSTSAALGR
jgi:hypothetical protein